MRRSLAAWLIVTAAVTGACASMGHGPSGTRSMSADARLAILRRSQVWTKTDVASMDLRAGPQGPSAFAPGATVTCDYVEREMGGATPKFTCAIPATPGGTAGPRAGTPDEVKVKYGVGNPEVYGEVLSSRLLWALGFGADRMYPVRVVCRGCPAKLKASETLPTGERVFDPAAIERKMTGRTLESSPDQGWSWKELDLVAPEAGGASVAERDALKLMAVLLQHGDSKAEQQRLVCLDPKPDAGASSETTCAQPFMLINDLGLTWGHADVLNRNQLGGVNFARWSTTPIWKTRVSCVGNLSKPWTGTLGDPVISEAGRRFLSELLAQLSDAQINDLFTVAHVILRPSAPNLEASADTSVAMWVAAFKQKRSEIASRRCD